MGVRVLLLSNGHGEDAIGATLARALLASGRGVEVSAFPLVGAGEPYRRGGIPVVGVQGVLPSGGFARLGPAQFWADVQAGLLGLFRRQTRALARLRTGVDAAVAVGDAVPLLLAAWWLRRPLAFFSTAKSEYIAGHLPVEVWLMRRYCRRVYARDERTARALAARGVPAEYCGNIMMDMVAPSGEALPAPLEGAARLAVLMPGSRDDAYDNAADMLAAVNIVAREPGWTFAVALAPTLQAERLAKRVDGEGWRLEAAPDDGGSAHEPGSGRDRGSGRGFGARLAGRLVRGEAEVWLVQGGFGDLLHRARVALGTAGTANEQAVGLGVPVVAFPGRGRQFTPRFLAAQKRLLGDGLLAVARDPEAVAAALRRAAEDETVREAVRTAGRERMGSPGGAARMARSLLELWGVEPATPGEDAAGTGKTGETGEAGETAEGTSAENAAAEVAGDGGAVPDASVVIPTYNGRPALEKVLAALGRQTYPADRFEVVVVDDGSTDDTPEALERARVEAPFELKVIRQPNRGRAAARNAGVRAARAPLIIFLDSDIVVEDGFVAAHVEAHWEAARRGERLVVNGPVIHTENFDDPTSTEPRWTDMSRAFFATGNASVARADLMAAGPFDEDFVEYGWEDLELGDRLRDLGLRSVTAPGARGFHLQRPARVAALPARLSKERQRGRTAIVYYRKRPTFRVRAKVQLLWPFFALDRLFTLGGLLTGDRMVRRLERWEAAGRHGLVRFWTWVLMQNAYMEGLREGLRRGV